MLLDSVIIMFIGMSVVLSFLVIMILVMNLTSSVLNSPEFLKLFPEPKPAPALPVKNTNETEMEEIAAAIAIVKANN